MKDKIILKSNFLEVYFGLFAPCLLYYNNGYVHNNRIVISLIFFKLYFNIGGANKQDSESEIYGFYFKSDPDAFIICWGDYCKTFLMPWINVLINRYLLTTDDIILPIDNDCLSLKELDEYIHNEKTEALCTRYYSCNGKTYRYYVTYIITRPALFKHIPLFNNDSFEIYTTLDKPIEGKSRFKMNTKYNIAIEKQINSQIAAFDSSKPF